MPNFLGSLRTGLLAEVNKAARVVVFYECRAMVAFQHPSFGLVSLLFVSAEILVEKGILGASERRSLSLSFHDRWMSEREYY